MFYKIPPKRSTCVLANFVRKNYYQELSKFAQSGHTALNSSSNEIVIAYFLKWAIYYLFFVVFGLFEYHYNYTANKCEKWSIWDSNLRPLEQEFFVKYFYWSSNTDLQITNYTFYTQILHTWDYYKKFRWQHYSWRHLTWTCTSYKWLFSLSGCAICVLPFRFEHLIICHIFPNFHYLCDPKILEMDKYYCESTILGVDNLFKANYTM